MLGIQPLAMAGQEAEKLLDKAVGLLVFGELERGEIQPLTLAYGMALVVGAEFQIGRAGAGRLVGDAKPEQVGAADVGKVLDGFDGAELVLADLVVIDEVTGWAQDGEQFELALDLIGLEGLHGAEVREAIMIRPKQGGVEGRVVGLGHVGEPLTGDVTAIDGLAFGGDAHPASAQFRIVWGGHVGARGTFRVVYAGSGYRVGKGDSPGGVQGDSDFGAYPNSSEHRGPKSGGGGR
ncbi:hypothetical protein D3C80_792940 [compost metagenome]